MRVNRRQLGHLLQRHAAFCPLLTKGLALSGEQEQNVEKEANKNQKGDYCQVSVSGVSFKLQKCTVF